MAKAESLTGPLVIGGFPGATLPASFADALRTGRRGGAILFGPNVVEGPLQVAALTRQLRAACSEPPLIGIDQEGGRVARLGAPVLRVPSMRAVASWGDVALAERIAAALGTELAALGFTIDFAPVLDVNTCATNPVIGDRAFGDDAAMCARFGVAWIRGLHQAGILACGKHFPGHGDTTLDSHTDLPTVNQPRPRLDAVELAPFRAAAAAGVAALMTAHVVFPALDPLNPATLSATVCTRLRQQIGFEGLLVTDDLEMQAIAKRFSVEDAAVTAIAAGCDALLICWNQEKQDRAVEALARESERSPAFRARCEEALARMREVRKRGNMGTFDNEMVARIVGGQRSQAIAAEIAGRLGL